MADREPSEKAKLIEEEFAGDLPLALPAAEQAKQRKRAQGPPIGPVILYGEAAEEYVAEEQKGDEGAVTTGWDTFDRSIEMGKLIRPGELVVIAARTSIGKTWIAQHLTERKLKADTECGCLWDALEMPSYQMAERLGSHALGMSPRELGATAKRGALDIPAMLEAYPHLSRIGFYEAPTTIEILPEIMAKARERLGRLVGIIVIDYTQLLAWQGNPRASLYEQATVNMRRLKDVAKTENAVILACAQLSRSGAGAGDREPSMSALRDSGAAEEAADRVLMFWRDPVEFDENGKAIKKDYQEIRGKIEKNRHGPQDARLLLRYDHAMMLSEVNDYDDYAASPTEAAKEDIPF